MSNHKTINMTFPFKLGSSWFLCFFLAYICSFFLSGRSVPLPTLDQSYQAVLEYARTQNFQFGKDIVFTFGPLGFLNTEVSQGLFPIQRILFALAWSGIVAWSVTGLAIQMPGLIRFTFLVWFLIYSNIGGLEQHAFLVMIYGCMILMGDVQKRKSSAAIFLAVFAFLALIKFNFFLAAMVSVILCILIHVGKRNFITSLAIPSFYGLVVLFSWVATGQKLENLFPWMRGSFAFVEGYVDAMTIFPKASVLAFCAIAGAMFIFLLWVVIRSARLTLNSVGILAVTTVYVFFSWKHGFVRADGHVMGYIFFLPMAFAILLSENFQKGMGRKLQLYLAALFMSVIILCNWAADAQEPGIMLTKLIDWPRYMRANSGLILSSITGNWENCFEVLQVNHSGKRSPDLPNTRSIVGMAPVDVMNYMQWAALANNLNYHPRPVIQGYAAYTLFLQDLNLSFYRSEKRPQYLLFNMETIDGRFPALDYATLLPHILINYKPVAKEGEFLVLRSSRGIPIDVGPVLIHEQTITFGESLDVSKYNDSLYIMQVDVKSTLFGKLIKFMFQTPEVTLNTITKGKKAGYRFIPAMAERGIIVSPLLLTNTDVMNYYDRATGSYAESISFSKSEFVPGQLSKSITVRIYKQDLF